MYKRKQDGFITLIILLVVVVGTIVGLAWWRVHGADAKKKAQDVAKQKACESVTEVIGGKQVTKNICK